MALTVKQLIEQLQKLEPEREVIICAREVPENQEICDFNIYHKGSIDAIALHFSEDAQADGKYTLEANKTFEEFVRVYKDSNGNWIEVDN